MPHHLQAFLFRIKMLISLLTGLTGLLGLVHAWEPDFILRVGEETIYTDCSPRNSVVVNGTFMYATLYVG